MSYRILLLLTLKQKWQNNLKQIIMNFLIAIDLLLVDAYQRDADNSIIHCTLLF